MLAQKLSNLADVGGNEEGWGPHRSPGALASAQRHGMGRAIPVPVSRRYLRTLVRDSNGCSSRLNSIARSPVRFSQGETKVSI